MIIYKIQFGKEEKYFTSFSKLFCEIEKLQYVRDVSQSKKEFEEFLKNFGKAVIYTKEWHEPVTVSRIAVN